MASSGRCYEWSNRSDVALDELVIYCLHALAAARSLASEAAVDRLVSVVVTRFRQPY